MDEETNVKEIVCRLKKERWWFRFYGCCNHYAAYTIHLVSILASFLASIIAAGQIGKPGSGYLVAVMAAIPGTLLATQNVLKLEYKCNWYYKKDRLLQHELYALKFENSNAAQASKHLKDIADKMDLEWPGFGTLVVRQNEVPPRQNEGALRPPTTE